MVFFFAEAKLTEDAEYMDLALILARALFTRPEKGLRIYSVFALSRFGYRFPGTEY